MGRPEDRKSESENMRQLWTKTARHRCNERIHAAFKRPQKSLQRSSTLPTLSQTAWLLFEDTLSWLISHYHYHEKNRERRAAERIWHG